MLRVVGPVGGGVEYVVPRFVFLFALALLAGCGVTIDPTACVTVCDSPGAGQSSVTMSVSPTTANPGQKLTVSATVTPSQATGVVGFYLGSAVAAGSEEYTPGPLSGGTVSGVFTNQLAVGSYPVTAIYGGNDSYAKSESLPVELYISDPAATCGLGFGAAVFTSGAVTQSNQSYAATGNNQSAVCVQNSGTSLTLTNPAITGGGGSTSSYDASGLASTVLAYGASDTASTGGTMNVTGGSIVTQGAGVFSAMASGAGAAVTLNGTSVTANGGVVPSNSGSYYSGEAIGAARGGSVTLNNVTAVNATQSAGGTMFAEQGGNSSIQVNGGNFTSTGTLARMEGQSTLNAVNATLGSANASSSFIVSNSVVYASIPGVSTVNITGGSILWAPSNLTQLFEVAGANATITLNGTKLTPSGNVQTFLSATSVPVLLGLSYSRTVFLNSNVILNANGVTIPGNMQSGSGSTLSLALTNGSSWNGVFSSSVGPGVSSLMLDAGSTWNVTGNCALDTLDDAAGISGTTISNIVGNGFTVTYRAANNPALGGKTYTLQGGGSLQPAS